MTQLTFADFLAEEGMQLALNAKPEWSKQADDWFASLPLGTEFTSEDLIAAIGLPDSSEPNANNAVGAKIRSWSKTHTAQIGYRKTIRVTSHSRVISIWRKK